MKLRPALRLISRDVIARLKPIPQSSRWYIPGTVLTAKQRMNINANAKA